MITSWVNNIVDANLFIGFDWHSSEVALPKKTEQAIPHNNVRK
jgi:hypothetical protein